jgi:hypothetical protein
MNGSINHALILGVLIVFASPVPAQQPTDAQLSAIRSACRSDYKSVCADVPTGGKPALQCLQQHADTVSSRCHDALEALSAKPTSPPAATAEPAPAETPQPPSAPQMSRREQAHLLRTDCGSDFQKFCSDVQLGGGRGLGCLQAHASQLTPLCQSALLAAQKK